MKHLFVFLFFVFFYTAVQAQPGTLDKSFGEGGIVTTKILSYHFAVTQQPDGKLLASGGYDIPGALVMRFLPDGNIDSSFGKQGYAVTNSITGEAFDVVLQPDGKILTVSTIYSNGNSNAVVVRFKPDGTPDSSFGTNGISIIPDFGDYSGYTKIGLEPDGSIVLDGSGTDNPETVDTEYSLLVCLNADGSLKKSFGTGSRVVNNAATRSSCITIQKDGKILTSGYTFGGGNAKRDYVTSRYNQDGSLDKEFGSEGNIITDGLGEEDVPGDILVQPDGKIVVGGYSADTKYYMAALRYNEDGTLDETFGKEGKVFVPFGDSSALAFALQLQPDGKIILAGGAYDRLRYQHANFAMCRITTDGSIDSSFAVNGRQVTIYKNEEEAKCVALQQDGKIVLGGFYYNDNQGYNSYLLIRYNGDEQGKQPLMVRIKRWLLHHGISWQMQQNKDVRYYTVQRSADNIIYKEVARLSNKTQVNKYEDASMLTGSSYYRLAAIGWDGSRTYSNTILIDDNAQVKMFPNPVRDNLQLQGLSGKTSVSVVDLQGNVRSSSVASGANYSVNTSQLMPGNYVLKLQHNNLTTTLPFVKE